MIKPNLYVAILFAIVFIIFLPIGALFILSKEYIMIYLDYSSDQEELNSKYNSYLKHCKFLEIEPVLRKDFTLNISTNTRYEYFNKK